MTYDFRGDAIAPHGGELCDRFATTDGQKDLEAKIAAASLPGVPLSPRALVDLELIASGAYSPLGGFMGPRDYQRTVAEGRLADGLPWGAPVLCEIPSGVEAATVVALRDGGRAVGAMTVVELWDRYAGGPVVAFDRPLGARRLGPRQTRALFRERGWRRIAALDLGGPITRTHEHWARTALEICDGLLLCPNDEVALHCCDILVECYLPRDRVVVTSLGPMSGGSLHRAIVRRNMGATHVITAADDKAFAAYGPEELGILPLRFAPAYLCPRCGGMASDKTCPHGAGPTEETMRPEIAAYLRSALR
jgi:sulfate adenylyltransferase